ncbi:hypothetical protein B0H14DRAFT_3857363 [Mycena olivaceomarginata]|nr:hypothetical protein B0H14DRAFT_3857363 [Mycena olivaceomarginata]
MSPWVSWANTHFDYGRAEQVPHVLWAATSDLTQGPTYTLCRHNPLMESACRSSRQMAIIDSRLHWSFYGHRSLHALRRSPASHKLDLHDAIDRARASLRRSSDAASESESASVIWVPLPHGELARTWMYIGLGATWQRSPHSRTATGSTNKRKHYLVRPSEPQRQWTKAHQDQHPSPLLLTAPPPPLTPGGVWAAAEILTPSARFSRYIYVSTRDTGVQTPAGDSIAIFDHVGQGTPGEKLQLVTQVFTGLDQLRGMQFGGE